MKRLALLKSRRTKAVKRDDSMHSDFGKLLQYQLESLFFRKGLKNGYPQGTFDRCGKFEKGNNLAAGAFEGGQSAAVVAVIRADEGKDLPCPRLPDS
ncbi:MAG: hypothetical protein R2864_12635 [Syntrophotaleaceae bacterium]